MSIRHAIRKALLVGGVAAALAVSVMIAVWQHGSAGRAMAQAAASQDLLPVTTIALVIEDQIMVPRQFVGRLESGGAADLGFDFDGRLQSVNVREGDAIRAGDVLARQRTEFLELEREAVLVRLTALREQVQLAEREEQSLARLVERGAVPANNLDRARAQRASLSASLAEATSTLAVLDLRIENATLLAPVDGVVGAVMARAEENVTAGQPVVSVFQGEQLQLRVGFPSNFDHGALRDEQIIVDNRAHPVTFLGIRPDLDARANTRIAVYAVDPGVAAGFGRVVTLTGSVALPMRGAWVPMDALRPGAEGSWTLLELSDDMIAMRLDVEVLHQRGDMAYVSGNFAPGTRVISAGVHRLVAGQRVREP